jgi:1,4-alpha-glucan branching enzyme
MKRLIPAAFLLACSCSVFAPARMPAPGDGAFGFWMPGAACVQVIGDWNEWGGLAGPSGLLDPQSGSMQCDDDGMWTVSLDIGRGRYRYAFLVDGHLWHDDPMNPVAATFDGHAVSMLVVTR